MFAHASVCIRMESIGRLMAYCFYTIDYLHAIFPPPAQILKSNEAYGEKGRQAFTHHFKLFGLKPRGISLRHSLSGIK